MSAITSMWEWIPGWILTALNFGMKYPDGDEDDLFALGDDWHTAAGALRALEPELRTVTAAAQKFYTGEGAVQAEREFGKLFSGQYSIEETAKALDDLGKFTRKGGTDLEHTKIMEAVFAGITCYSVYQLLAAWPWGSAGVPLALGAGRTSIGIAAEQGAKRLALEAGTVGLRTLLKPYLKQIAIAGLKMGAMGAGLDLGIQGLQIAAGHRDGGIDLDQTLHTGVSWAAGGLVGAPVGMGVNRLLGTALSPAMRGLISGVAGGAAGGIGMYGAGIGYQVAEQWARHGHVDWSKVDTRFQWQMVGAGAALGGMHGVRGAGQQAGAAPMMGREGVGAPETHAAGSRNPIVTEATNQAGKQAFHNISKEAHPDLQAPAERPRAGELYKEATAIKGEAEANGGYSDQHVSRLNELREQWAQRSPLDGSAAHPDAAVRTESTAVRPDGGAHATQPESLARATDSGIKPMPADRGASVADSGAKPAPQVDRAVRPVSPERAAGLPREAPAAAESGAADKTARPAAGRVEGADRTANLAAGQHDKPAPVSRADAAAPRAAESVTAEPTPHTGTPAAEPPRTVIPQPRAPESGWRTVEFDPRAVPPERAGEPGSRPNAGESGVRPAAEPAARANVAEPGPGRERQELVGVGASEPHRGAASNVGEFRGDSRLGLDLNESTVRREIDNNLLLITPERMSWNPDQNVFYLHDGRTVTVRVADHTLTKVAEFVERPGGYEIQISPRARNQDIARAVAHELAEIDLAQRPEIPRDTGSDRPDRFTAHLGGRHAELRVLNENINRAMLDPARADELPALRRDLLDLADRLGLRDGPESPGRRLLAEHDPALLERLGLDGDPPLAKRPVIDKGADHTQFDRGVDEHLNHLEPQLSGEFKSDLLRVEKMALDGRMREELVRRVFDPIFEDTTLAPVREEFKRMLNRELNPINDAVNRPGLSGGERVNAVHRAIDEFHRAMPEPFRRALGADRLELMHEAAKGLVDENITGVLDHSANQVHVGGERMSLADFLHGLDRANRAASANGVGVEYSPVVHKAVDGHSVVEVLSRPRAQHRLPLERYVFGDGHERIALVPRDPAPAAAIGGHTVDVGVGRSAFAVEMAPAADRAGGGLILQTELAEQYVIPAQRLRKLGILDPGPFVEPGSLMVFGDLLFGGKVLGDGTTGGVARIFINNVNAHFKPPVYDALAARLPEVLAPGGRVELQWDMTSERVTGGYRGDRGHIQGDLLWDAVQRLPEHLASRFSKEEIEFGPGGNRDYAYSIKAATSNEVSPEKLAQFRPPVPDHAMVIKYEPEGPARPEPASPDRAGAHQGTASPVGEFHGNARPAGLADLTQAELQGEIGNNVRLITPDAMAWNRDGQHFVLRDAEGNPIGEIAIRVGETHDGAVAEFAERADGSGYDVQVSPRARSQDVARAVAHELAEIQLGRDPAIARDPVNDRPEMMTDHLGGRYAELKVLAGHIDRATFDPARAHELPGLRADLAQLADHLGLRDGPAAADRWALLERNAPEVARRLGLEFEGDGLLADRPTFDRDLVEPTFEADRSAHLERFRDQLSGEYAPDVVRAEAMSLDGRMREELARRIFDPIFSDRAAAQARRAVPTADLLRALDPINEAINHPTANNVTRAVELHRAIDRFHDAMPPEFRDALGRAAFERMHDAADHLANGTGHRTGVLDHTDGRVEINGVRTSLPELLHTLDRANQGATRHGLNLEYTAVIHTPVEGRSAVEVLSRPQPQHRLPLEQNVFGSDNRPIPLTPRDSVPAAAAGGHTVDVGVGRSAFGVEMTPAGDRSGGGLIIKTELADDFAVAGQRRRNLGILDPGPLTEPGTVMVFGDLLFGGKALGDGVTGGVARIYINNVSAHFEPAVYDALAARLPESLAPGGRIELQWDMKPEKPVESGGMPGDRGHIRGDHLWEAVQRLPEPVASRFRVAEDVEFPSPGNSDYDYTIDAGASNRLDANKMAQFVPPRPDRRMVIVYEPRSGQ